MPREEQLKNNLNRVITESLLFLIYFHSLQNFIPVSNQLPREEQLKNNLNRVITESLLNLC